MELLNKGLYSKHNKQSKQLIAMKEIAGIKVYTVKETAELLQVTAQTVRKYIKSKKLIGQRIGRPYYISEQSIQSFLTGGLINEFGKQSKQ